MKSEKNKMEPDNKAVRKHHRSRASAGEIRSVTNLQFQQTSKTASKTIIHHFFSFLPNYS